MVKKTVNQDDPTVYHLFYADERGSSGADITFFEYPGAPQGRAGDGMVHLVSFRVGSEESLDFWRARVGGAIARRLARLRRSGRARARAGRRRLGRPAADGERARHSRGAPHPRLRRRARVRVAARARASSCCAALGFEPGWEARGDTRGGFYRYDPPPAERGLQAAGTVHHVAWASKPDEHEAWRAKVIEGGGQPTPVIDRFYFKSIYFREPSGVLFEIATIGPGFTADEPFETLGESLSLPPNYEQYRAQVEQILTPLPNPRAERSA